MNKIPDCRTGMRPHRVPNYFPISKNSEANVVLGTLTKCLGDVKSEEIKIQGNRLKQLSHF